MGEMASESGAQLNSGPRKKREQDKNGKKERTAGREKQEANGIRNESEKDGNKEIRN